MDDNNVIFFIRNNVIIQKFKLNNLGIIPDYDFFVINKDINQKKFVTVCNNNEINLNKNYTICNFTFILVILKNNNQKYDVTQYLKDYKKTYYIKDAILFDKNFNKWLCIKYLKCKLENFSTFIIDQNANEFELSQNQYIKLGLNNYHISELS